MTEQRLNRKHRRLLLSDNTEVPAVREEIADSLAELGYTEHDVFAVRLATEEALLNAIEHGNKSDRTKKVTVSYLLDWQKAEITVTDEGPGFDTSSIPDCTAAENVTKPRGRGIALMRGFMDVVEFGPEGNAVKLIKFNSASGAGRGETQKADPEQ